RRARMGPDYGRYRDDYLAARAAKDDFAAAFYLRLVPPAGRKVLVARADVDALGPLSVLARMHLGQGGRPSLALPLLIEIAKVKKAKLGPDDPDTLEVLNQLGVLHWRLGQFDKSIPVFEEIVEVRRVKFGRDDPQTLNDMANLGVNYKDAGRLKEAIPLLEEVIQGTKKAPALGWVPNQLFDALLRVDDATAAK